jgi:hypothetical protein
MTPARWWLLIPFLVSVMVTALHAQEINWQEAVARLARERTLAETGRCVGSCCGRAEEAFTTGKWPEVYGALAGGEP